MNLVCNRHESWHLMLTARFSHPQTEVCMPDRPNCGCSAVRSTLFLKSIHYSSNYSVLPSTD